MDKAELYIVFSRDYGPSNISVCLYVGLQNLRCDDMNMNLGSMSAEFLILKNLRVKYINI